MPQTPGYAHPSVSPPPSEPSEAAGLFSLVDHIRPSRESIDDLVENRFTDLFQTEAISPVGGDGQDTPVDPIPRPNLADYDRSETREMFGSIAALYVRPVKQFLARLRSGPLSTDWLEMCLPAMGMVARSARTMGLADLIPFLETFESLLRKAGESEEKTIDGTIRGGILLAYADLENLLPQAFTIEEGSGEKDGVVLHSLLRQVPDVGKVTLDKIFAAGLSSIEMIERASAQDLARTTGIPMHLSERIRDRILEHCTAARSYPPAGSATGAWLALLAPVVSKLEEHQDAYQRLVDREDGRPEDAKRRKLHRRARQDATLQANVLLAEMGELALVDEIQRLAYDRRIKRLGRLMESMRSATSSKAAAASAQQPSESESQGE